MLSIRKTTALGLAAAVLAVVPGVAGFSSEALAQAQRIGAASSIQNSVSRISGGSSSEKPLKTRSPAQG